MSTTLGIIDSLRTEFIQEATNAPKLFKDLVKVEHYIAESYKMCFYLSNTDRKFVQQPHRDKFVERCNIKGALW